jgi:hypothetical protein
MKIRVLRMKSTFQNYSIICVCAPMENKSEAEKDQFYAQSKHTFNVLHMTEQSL